MTFNYTSDAEPTEIAPGIFLRVPGVASFSGVNLEGAPYTVAITVDRTDQGVRPRSVTVTAEGSADVSGTTLRSVRVWQLATSAIAAAVTRGDLTTSGDGTQIEISGNLSLSELEVARIRLAGPTDESLAWVARFFHLGTVLGLPPVKSVEDNLGLPRTTASKWVRRAREQGLIEESNQTFETDQDQPEESN